MDLILSLPINLTLNNKPIFFHRLLIEHLSQVIKVSHNIIFDTVLELIEIRLDVYAHCVHVSYHPILFSFTCLVSWCMQDSVCNC